MPKIKFHIRSVILVLTVITVLFLTVNTTNAAFDDDYQQYLSLNDLYREKHAAYLTTRGEYLTYGTLTSKNSAITAVKEMMVARDDVLLQHYQLLRQKYITYTIYLPLLDSDEKFVNDHKPTISPIADLNDAVKISVKLEKQHIPLQIDSRKIVGAILYAKLENLKNEVIQTEYSALNIINTLKAESKDVTQLERWLLDAQSKRAQAELKQREIEGLIADFRATNLENLSRDFILITSVIAESNQYLKEAVSYLNELKEAIKYGEY